MKDFNQNRKFGSIALFLLWAFIRFFLMSKLRTFLMSLFSLNGPQRVLLNHSLIVLEALILFVFYWLVRQRTGLEPIQYRLPTAKDLRWGVLGGLVSFLLIIPVVLHFGMSWDLHFDSAGALGNLFSNGAEEVIYRGILFVASITLVRSSWAAIAISSLAFALAHWDLPVLFQASIAVIGILWGYLYVHTRNLAVPYIAHMIADLLADSLFR